MASNDEKDAGGLPLLQESLRRIEMEAPAAIRYLKSVNAQDIIPILGLKEFQT